MTTLRDLLIDSRDGEWGKGEPFCGGSWASVIRGTDFAGARVGDLAKIPIRVLQEKHLARKALAPGDVLLETAGGTKDQPTGRTLYVTQRLLSSLPHPAVCASFARFLRFDPNKVNPGYAFWLLQDHYQRRELMRFHTQHTGVARFQFTTFADTYQFDLPSAAVQQVVAEALFAFDDLIEVNQRRITVLEEMARRLFDEWFVQFRFPGHKSVEMVETELGPVPRGWWPGCIQDISEYISRGIAPKYDEEADSKVINQKCIRDKALNMEPSRRQSKPIPALKAVAYGDVLINSTGVGTLGRVAQVLAKLESTTVDTHVTIVRASSSVNIYFFGAQLLHLQAHFERQGIGATGQTELSRTAIAETPIIIPPESLRERFGELIGPMRQQSELLRLQNSRLRIARDLLLPKLISGDIDVSKAEDAFAEAAE